MIKPLFLTISAQIADNIRKDIILGKLDEGTPLREAEISKQYNVSRGPVRDALKELSKEGFLDMIPNVGVKVAKPPSEETLKLVIQLRKQVETFVVEHVYDRFSESDFMELDKILYSYKYACETNNLHDIIDLDIHFHQYIISKTYDFHIRDLWRSIVNRMLFRYNRFDDMLESYNEHVRIFNALKSKNKEDILKELESNIQ